MPQSLSGTSVKGMQQLSYGSQGDRYVSLYVGTVFPDRPEYKGFISSEIYNGLASYQTAGMPLWYQGVFFDIGPGQGYPFSVFANWSKAGLIWTLHTFG